jgi:amino acid permease
MGFGRMIPRPWGRGNLFGSVGIQAYPAMTSSSFRFRLWHGPLMHLVIVGWLYVVLMMALAEALSSQGTVLGAVFTFILYGMLPLGIVVYILSTPARKRARAQREAASAERDRDTGSHAAGGPESAVAPERKEG